MSADAEAAFLATLQSTDDLRWAKTAGVSPDDFAHYGPVWAFVTEHGETGTMPTPAALQARFPDFRPVAPTGDVRFVFNELRTATARRQLTGTLVAAAHNLEDGTSPETIAEDVRLQLMALRQSALPGATNLLDMSARLADVEQMVSESAERGRFFTGYRTGIEMLDIQGIGWRPGEFVGIIARPGVGKTQLALRVALEAIRHKHHVFFISMEMLADDLGKRLDPMTATMVGIAPIPSNIGIQTGELTMAELESYRRLQGVYGTSQRFQVWDMEGRPSAPTIGDITDEAKHQGADILIIDGFKRLRDQQGGRNGIDQHTNKLNDLYQFGKSSGTVVIVAEHASRQLKAKDMPTINDIYMGDFLAQNGERIICMSTTRDDPTRRLVTVPKSRYSRALNAKKTISMDVDLGDVGRWADTEDQKGKSELKDFVSDPYKGLPERIAS